MMKKDTGKTVIGAIAASSLVLGGVGGVASVAFADDAQPALQGESAEVSVAPNSAVLAPEKVEGVFAFCQGMVAPNDQLSSVFKKASAYLCGATFEATSMRGSESAGGTVSMGGAVNNSFVAALDDERFGAPQKLILGCSCSGDGIDGAAHGDAEVLGASIRSLVYACDPYEGANTITFTASDGYKVSLPLNYVLQRPSVLVYEVNGQPIDEVMGGENQLWLGSVSARSFIRDVVAIDIEVRETPPDPPNLVNVPGHTPHISIASAS